MQKETTARENDVMFARIMGIASSLKNGDFGVTRATRTDTATYFVVARRFDYEDMNQLAKLFSDSDLLVHYVPGSNFLVVQKNPTPTPATIFSASPISRIPATLDEALNIAAKHYNGVHAIDQTIGGKRQLTLVCTSADSRSTLSELAYELSMRGVRVQFFENCNFIWASDCPVEAAVKADLLTAVGQ